MSQTPKFEITKNIKALDRDKTIVELNEFSLARYFPNKKIISNDT